MNKLEKKVFRQKWANRKITKLPMPYHLDTGRKILKGFFVAITVRWSFLAVLLQLGGILTQHH